MIDLSTLRQKKKKKRDSLYALFGFNIFYSVKILRYDFRDFLLHINFNHMFTIS